MNTITIKKRPTPASCSQPGCVHGVQYKIIASGKEICSLCARLLDKAELTILHDVKEKT
jgi:hypothetical protein